MPDGENQCCYEKCENPTNSSQYHTIESDCQAGGKDWSTLVGKIVCETCYNHFSETGTLEREERADAPPLLHDIDEKAKGCVYVRCINPLESTKYYTVPPDSNAGGQNWAGLAGRVLCKACYNRFRNTGRLERRAERSYNEEKDGTPKATDSERKRKREPQKPVPVQLSEAPSELCESFNATSMSNVSALTRAARDAGDAENPDVPSQDGGKCNERRVWKLVQFVVSQLTGRITANRFQHLFLVFTDLECSMVSKRCSRFLTNSPKACMHTSMILCVPLLGEKTLSTFCELYSHGYSIILHLPTT
jgi:hypothetical protein